MADIIVFDLEFTAWPGSLARNWTGPGEFREVVQIGAVRADPGTLAERASLSLLVRPVLNPVLSDYFTTLTGITNADLARDGMAFDAGLAAFAAFCAGAGQVLANGEDADILRADADRRGLPWPLTGLPFRNIRGLLARHLGQGRDLASCDIAALAGEGLTGHAHTGLADARSILAGLRLLRRQGLF